MSIRRVIVASVVLALAAALGYTAYWFHVAGQLRKGIEGWAEHRRDAGWLVEWSALSVHGFPGRITATMATPRLGPPAGWRWGAEGLTADASPFDISQVRLGSPGRHSLGWAGAEWVVTAQDARADLDFTDGRLDAASLTIVDLAGEGFDAAALAATLDPTAAPEAAHDTVTATFSASVRGLGLPALPGLVLSREVALAELAGRVIGPIPPGPPAEALARWSADGGTIELDRLAIEWEPMGMEAEGTVAFDPAMQPLASLSARVRGFSPLMDRLTAAGMVDAGAASAAKLLLSMMAKPDAQGRPAVPVPVTLQDGTLFLGPAKVARVPPIQWPRPEGLPVPR